MERPSHQIIQSYLTSFTTGDPEEIAGHVSTGFVNEHTAALGRGSVGRDQYKNRLPGFLADMVDLAYRVEEMIGDENRVAVFYTMTALWQGQEPISVRGVQRLVVEDGLITHRTDYWDSAVFLGQVSAEARDLLSTIGITPPDDR